MTRGSQIIEGPVLYLDFDGVLHPDEVHRIRGRIVLRRDGMNLFEWAPLLVQHLEPYPDLRIILSTSWVRVLSYHAARAWLPAALRSRVIGATWHSAMNQSWWDSLSRYEEIVLHAKRHRVTRWLAIDDDTQGWPEDAREPLVHTDPMLGIATPGTRAMLLRKLEELSA